MNITLRFSGLPAAVIRLFVAFSFLTGLGFAFVSSAKAQNTGTVKGLVYDAATGVTLEGAEVVLEGTGASTTTPRGGAFVLRDVAAGSYRVMVTYPGLEAKSVLVNVTAGGTADMTIELGGQTIKMDEFKVEGTKEGMAKAVAIQKSAEEGKIVAATDQFGDISNGNVAEYLKFLPGVSMDGNAISLRGLSSAFTNVTMDNNAMASASSGEMNRRFEFEQLVIDAIESVEVFKTLTPDRPATNTGGSVNLVTKSAFDRSTRYSHYRLYGYVRRPYLDLNRVPGVKSGQLIFPMRPNFSLSYINRISKKVGVYIGASQYSSFGVTDRSEYGLSYNPNDGGNPDDPLVNAWRYHIERGTSDRRSISTRIDYKVTPRTTISATFAANDFDMWFNYHQQGIYTGSLGPVAVGMPSPYPLSGGEVHSRPGQGYIQLSQSERNKHGATTTGGLSLVHDFENGAKLNASTYWSDANNYYDDVSSQTYGYVYPRRGSLTTGITNLGAIIPNFYANDSSGSPIDINDLSSFNIPSFTTEPRTAGDTRAGFSVDYFHPLRIKGVPVAVKVGGSYDNRQRNTHKDFLRGGGGVPAGQVQNYIDDVWSGYAQNELGVPGRTWVDLRKLYEAHKGITIPPYQDPLDGDFDEDALAFYARVDIKPTNDLLIVAGLRHERLASDNYNGTADAHGRFKSDGDYASLNIKYTPTRNLVFRAAVAESVGLPDYGDLLPSSFDIEHPNTGVGSRGTITLTNPGLETYDVMNYDFGVEYYLRNSGAFSIGLFRKQFKNYIASVTQALTEESAAQVGFDFNSVSDPDQYDLVYKLNIPDPGYYSGVEVSYSQMLGFLPAPFNTIGVQLNYTWINIDAIESGMVFDQNSVYQDEAIREQIRHALDLGAVKRQFNVVFNWRYKKLKTMLTVHSEGRVLRSNAINPVRYFRDPVSKYMNEYRYSEPRTVVDLRCEYDLLHNLAAYVQFRDLFNAPIVYTSNGHFLNHQEKGDPAIEVGLKGWF